MQGLHLRRAVLGSSYAGSCGSIGVRLAAPGLPAFCDVAPVDDLTASTCQLSNRMAHCEVQAVGSSGSAATSSMHQGQDLLSPAHAHDKTGARPEADHASGHWGSLPHALHQPTWLQTGWEVRLSRTGSQQGAHRAGVLLQHADWQVVGGVGGHDIHIPDQLHPQLSPVKLHPAPPATAQARLEGQPSVQEP